ncbi:hypothetical protein C7S18_15605 [Ahniella affigens]|uniref:Right handed beta helix domain-containing protein n=1 Tax=Ahniella affigens TaxID=2021234 RepID=A0A2P1PUK4_9GAMM|nr:choice-of-anchor Q domain-containing protein [Ahniella affigens]AVP98523.1 hypothetical protein C7S18_15605 [Ahniella affigens]
MIRAFQLLRSLLVLLLALLAAGPLAAQSFCTPVAAQATAGGTVLGNGSPGSVTTAMIQAALDAGGAITFNLGSNPSTIVLTSTLTVSRDVVLDGGGLVTLSGGDARRILRIINTNPNANAPVFTVTLQHLNLLDARVSDGRGAAIFADFNQTFPHKINLSLVDVDIVNSDAPLDGSSQDDGGGALYALLLNRIDIADSRFQNNTGSNGGAVYSLGTLAVNIVDSAFIGNQAIGTGGNPGNGGNAGGLGVDGAARLLDVCRTRFVDNTSNAFGAGFFSVMYDTQSRSRFEDVLFQGNRQLSSTQHTGGAYIQDGPFALERVAFINNEANGFGGLFVAGSASGMIRNATFAGNVARQGLGAAMALTNTAPIQIVNSTIANNVATAAFAAGISINAPNQLTLTNTIFANNSGGNVFVNWAMNNPAQFDGGGNMQWPQVRSGGGGNETPVTASASFADAMLGAVANNGGPTPTLAMASNSPARDTGVNTASVPSLDQRGYPRDAARDRGAFEFGAEGLLFRDSFE